MSGKHALIKPSKARVALNLALHPSWWSDLLRRVRLNVGRALLPPPMGQDRGVASSWAAGLAVDEDELFQRLGLVQGPRFADTYPALLEQAAQAEMASAETLGGGGSADLIFRLCEALEAQVAFETGVAYGWSSLALLASVTRRGGRLFSVDLPHPLLRDADLTGTVVPAALRKDWTLMRAPDHIGVSRLLRQVTAFDFVHYDSEKSYDGRAATYRRLWKHLRSGGLFMSDDVGDNTAFRDFAAEVDLPPLVVHAPGSGLSGARYVGLLRKP